MKKKTQNTSGARPRRIVHNLMILDESGSMESIRAATIQGFNEVVQTIKGIEKRHPEQEHFVSLLTFNGLGIKTVLFNEKARRLHELDQESYRPDSLTPLYDAIGFGANKLRRVTDRIEGCRVLVTILTDGMENDSKEYSLDEIKRLIEKLKKRGWTFTYIGANHRVEEVAYSLSITDHLKFDANSHDVKRAFDEDRDARVLYARSIARGEKIEGGYFDKSKK